MSGFPYGTCSICKGPVMIPIRQYSTLPARPTCASCGATAKKDPYGPEIEMEPKRG